MPRQSQRVLGQNGFAALEAVLIVVIVAIIAGTGYFIYHANKNVDKNLKATASTSPAAPNGGKGGGEGGDSKPQTGPAKTQVFLIPEWKVASPVPAPPATPGDIESGLIQYSIDSASQPVNAKFTSQELVDLGCTADKAPAGVISRALGTDPYYLDDGTASGKTVAQQFASSPIKPYKVVNKYYYWYTSSQAACGDSAKARQLQSSASSTVKEIITHLEQE